MAARDPNRLQLARVAEALGDLRDDVVFVGGATVGLLITDAGAPAVRPTKDVDVIVEVASYADYRISIASALTASGFRECTDSGAPVCAWVIDGIRVDVMPTEGDVLGFTNPWYRGAVAHSERCSLDGAVIRVISPAFFLATKFVAFESRGGGDWYGSHDLEDIIALLDGRLEVVEDVAVAPEDVRRYLGDRAESLLDDADFRNALPGHVETDRDVVVLGRLRAIRGTC